MVTKVIDYYEISIKLLIAKKYWNADNAVMNKEIIADKVQQGLEVPIEDINVIIR
jgi:hypothetical protein